MAGPLIWLGQHLFSSLMFFLTLVLASVLVRQRRSPGSAMAWLLAIVLIPYVGVPFYLLWGRRKLPRQFRKKQALYAPRRFTETPGNSTTVERMLLSAGAPSKRHHNRIELISDGTAAYRQLLQLIEGAKHDINIATFILGRDDVAAAVLDRLRSKAQAGVKVRFLLDGFGALQTNHKRLRELEAAGGSYAAFVPLFHRPFHGNSNLRNHRKIVVVDGELALVGGMNLAHEYMGPSDSPARWVDLAFLAEGPIVPDLEKIFESDWRFAAGQSITPRPKIETHGHPQAGSAVVQVVASGPDVPTDSLYDGLLAAIFSAEKRIWIATPYFIPDETLSRALELACRRGVDVRILIPARSNHLLADVGRGSYLRQIEVAGGKILLHPKMVHAKATLIDASYAIVGSANTDMRSLFLNYEVSLFLYSQAEIEAVVHWFEAVGASCTAGYPRFALGMKTLEGACRILSPLL